MTAELDIQRFESQRRERLIGERLQVLEEIAQQELILQRLRNLSDSLTHEISRTMVDNKYEPPNIIKHV